MNKIQKIAFIYHYADNDGKLSRFVGEKIFDYELGFIQIDKHIPIVEMIGYNYGKDPEHDKWMSKDPEHQYDLYIFVDITPPIEWLKEIEHELGITKNVQIFDHHEHAKNEISKLNLPIQYIFDIDKCGAEILYYNMEAVSKCYVPKNNWFNQEITHYIKKFENILTLVGDYDTWRFDSTDYIRNPIEPLQLNEYLKYLNDYDKIVKWLHHAIYNDMGDMYKIGEVLVNSIINQSKRAISSGKEIELFNMKGYILPGYPNYWLLDLLNEHSIKNGTKYDFYIGFNFDVKTGVIKCSIRSINPNCSVREIANYYGGGGHEGAAGFTLSFENFQHILNN